MHLKASEGHTRLKYWGHVWPVHVCGMCLCARGLVVPNEE